MERTQSYITAQVVEAAWKYASHLGGADGMIGVMHILKNRVDAGWGPYLHVLDTMEKWQAAPPVTKTHPETYNRNFLKALSEVDGVCDGTHKDPTNGATYFGDTTDIKSEWFLEAVARNPNRVRCGGMASWTYWK